MIIKNFSHKKVPITLSLKYQICIFYQFLIEHNKKLLFGDSKDGSWGKKGWNKRLCLSSDSSKREISITAPNIILRSFPTFINNISFVRRIEQWHFLYLCKWFHRTKIDMKSIYYIFDVSIETFPIIIKKG